jgi:hypothetical protein
MNPNKKDKRNRAKQASPTPAPPVVTAAQLRQRNNQDITRSLEASVRFVRYKGVLIVGSSMVLLTISVMGQNDSDPLQIMLGAVLAFAGCNALYFLFHIIVPLIQRAYPGLIKIDLTQHETEGPDDDRQSYSDEINERISRQSDENRWHEEDHGHRH